MAAIVLTIGVGIGLLAAIWIWLPFHLNRPKPQHDDRPAPVDPLRVRTEPPYNRGEALDREASSLELKERGPLPETWSEYVDGVRRSRR